MKAHRWLIPFNSSQIWSPKIPPKVSRFTSTLHTSANSSVSNGSNYRYQPLTVLEDASVGNFREKYFISEFPTVFPRGHFRDIPAYERWFGRSPLSCSFSSSTPSSDLNVAYLREHGANAFVPLELSRLSSSSSNNGNGDDGNNSDIPTFARFHAPLTLFLDWIQSSASLHQSSSVRLYLAQCQLLDIPQVLRDDLPTPNVVLQAGRGDVYDTNIWIGLPPTYTPLHRDPNPNLFVQLAGRKEVRLLAPDDGWALFASVRQKLGRSSEWEAAVFRGEEMMQGEERMLLDQAVWKDARTSTSTAANDMLSRKEGYETQLGPGDGLFIPKGWWHSIKGIGEGVTASVSWPVMRGFVSMVFAGLKLIYNRPIGGSGEPDIQRIYNDVSTGSAFVVYRSAFTSV